MKVRCYSNVFALETYPIILSSFEESQNFHVSFALVSVRKYLYLDSQGYQWTY